jgi:hypothetical protein
MPNSNPPTLKSAISSPFTHESCHLIPSHSLVQSHVIHSILPPQLLPECTKPYHVMQLNLLVLMHAAQVQKHPLRTEVEFEHVDGGVEGSFLPVLAYALSELEGVVRAFGCGGGGGVFHFVGSGVKGGGFDFGGRGERAAGAADGDEGVGVGVGAVEVEGREGVLESVHGGVVEGVLGNSLGEPHIGELVGWL